MYKPKSSTTDDVTSSLIGSGELLLMLSLLCDGLTGAVQERMKSEHKTKSAPMMINMNFWSVIFLGTALVLTGELWEFYQFAFIKHPGILLEIPLLALASALGQVSFLRFSTVQKDSNDPPQKYSGNKEHKGVFIL